jgi:hypothetical protein
MSTMSGSDNDPPSGPSTRPPTAPGFLTLAQVSDELATSNAQTYALVRSGALRANKIGGRTQRPGQRRDIESYWKRTRPRLSRRIP